MGYLDGFNMRFNVVLVFFTLFLIITITPSSAVLTKESYEHSPIKNAEQNNLISDNDEDLDELEMYTSSLKEDSRHVKGMVSEYDWRFWKWPKITINILKTLSDIRKDFDNVDEPLNRINEESNKLNHKTNTSSAGLYINNVGNGFCEDDACRMARELTKKLNTTFTAEDVSASELREGDIVQYMSEGKYPRYLAVQKIIEQRNTSSRQLLDFTPVNVPTVLLKGTGDKIVKVPIIGEVICLTAPNGIGAYDVLQNTVQIQKNDISNSKKNSEKLEKTGYRLDDAFEVFKWVTIVLGGVSTALFVVAASSTPIPPLSAPIWVAFGISTGLLALSGVITGSLYISYQKKAMGATNLNFNAILNENDLNTYTAIEAKSEMVMYVSTFNGIPIIKQPPITDWREFTFIRIENPQHGDLLPGPGLQFLYGPTEGYTGFDRFKYMYTDKYGRIKGTVTVNINIKPIPTFNLEPEGSVA